MEPTLQGFLAFLRCPVGIPLTALRDEAVIISVSFNYAMNVAYNGFQGVPNHNPALPSLYATLVYNLGTHALVASAPDIQGQTFFQDLRAKFGLLSAFGGVISSASDEGTSASAILPNWVNDLSLGDLMLLKTPWGRDYLALAQKAAPAWGLT